MNTLEILSECIWWILHNTANGVLAFLDVNFSIVALVIHVIRILANSTVEYSSSLIDVFKCCYYDFLTFSSELALCINFILTTVINFLSRRVNEIHYFSCYITNFMNGIFAGILAATNGSIYLFNEMFQNILYFLTVIFRAILILLQLGPNLLIFLYEIIIHCFKQCWGLVYLGAYSLLENMYILPFHCQKIITHVPLKAYFGFLLFITLFHNRNLIKRYLENFSLFAFNQCTTLWLHTLPKTIAYVILFYKRCKTSLFKKSPEETESSAATPENERGLRKKALLGFQYYFQRMLDFLKVPISRVSEELSDLELQELQKKLHAEKERRVCVICKDRERCVLLYPCRHMCMCEECIAIVQTADQGCPLCRQGIINTLKVYT